MDIAMSNSIENLNRTSESLPSESGVNSHNQNDTSNANEGLSKRAQRKLLKRQQWLETRPERRAKEKAKKRAKIEKIRQEKGFNQTFSEHRKRLKQKKMSESLCKVTVAIDMAFENLMNQKDLGKCLKQLLHCYSINRRLAQPLQFHITSFEGERLKLEMERHQGYENWDCVFHTDAYVDVFTSPNSGHAVMPHNENHQNSSTEAIDTSKNAITMKQTENILLKNNIHNDNEPVIKSDDNLEDTQENNFIDPKRIVYLTSESENILDKFDPNKVYIIGGLVDHNNHKGLCHRLALEKGVSHARFPIQEAGIEMKTRQVLTIDHVFRIIGAVASEGKSWKEALIETLPNRKGAKEVHDKAESDELQSDKDDEDNS